MFTCIIVQACRLTNLLLSHSSKFSRNLIEQIQMDPILIYKPMNMPSIVSRLLCDTLQNFPTTLIDPRADPSAILNLPFTFPYRYLGLSLLLLSDSSKFSSNSARLIGAILNLQNLQAYK